MDISEVCERYSLPKDLVEVFGAKGIKRLYPPQAEAIKKGLLDGKNFVMSVATSAGKTLVAELCMLRSIFREKGRCLYIVPLRALASEKYEEFKEMYGPLGVRVGISTGDFDKVDPHLATYDILVATSEKVDSLLRHRAKWLADVISVVVLDEVHIINDPGRGPTLEVLTARLRQVNPKLQVIALSATIANSEEIAEWLNAELVKSEWRPVPLKRGVAYDGKIRFEDGSSRKIEAGEKNRLAALAVDTVKDGGQTLIFTSTRRSAQTTAELVTEVIRKFLTDVEREKLDEIARSIERALGESTRTCRQLANCVRSGAAFHHAGLHHDQRKAVESAFKQNLIKVIAATPTLAAGVNLPARRVVIKSYRRYDQAFGLQFIPVLEIQQMFGRAGRPQYDKYGEAVLFARNEDEVDPLFEEFIYAEPERITSKLASEPALRTHVLASISAGYANSVREILNFLGYTFFACQRDTFEVERIIERVVDFLEREEMVKKSGELLTATPFGDLVSSLYIDPLSGVVLRDGLKNISASTPTAFGLLHLVCHTSDMEGLYLSSRDTDELNFFILKHMNEFLCPVPDEDEDPAAYEYFMGEVKTARMLQTWLEEVSEDEIHEQFRVGAGDIRRLVDTADWLLYASHELARLFKTRKALSPIRKLRERIKYGVKEELLPLVAFRGIGRVRARALYQAGYRKLADLRQASVQALARVPYIGIEIARGIKKQAEEI